MLYNGYLIILDGQNIKKSVSELSIFQLQRLENRISSFCPSPLGSPPPKTTTPKSGEEHTKKVQNMLHQDIS